MQNPQHAKHGDAGEEILQRWLEKKGWNCSGPYRNEQIQVVGWHDYDFRCEKGSVYILCDAKAKAARTHYCDTGIDRRQWETYLTAYSRHSEQKGFYDFFIYFLDEHEKSIRSVSIKKLAAAGLRNLESQHLIKYEKEIVYFDLSLAKVVATLSDEEAGKLRKDCDRKWDYKQQKENK